MKFNIIFSLMLAFSVSMTAQNFGVKADNMDIRTLGDKLSVTMRLVVDKDSKVRSNQQIVVTPFVESADGKNQVFMPSVLINGRNMHYIYQRNGKGDYYKVLRHKQGTETAVEYQQSLALSPWMHTDGARLTLNVDTCGCGRLKGRNDLNYPLDLNKAKYMLCMPFPRPDAKGEGRIIAHNGRARVQFEVNKTELHEEPYRCKSGQLIDNRKELKVIDDSIQYALSNPNVEIASIIICGYASPESPYDHNQYLATNRSRSLSEYIGSKYQLPMERCTYTSVPENWKEFRELVVAATDISEEQRTNLLALIDRPVTTSAEYDLKESELKTSAAFAALYRSKILPEWFPQLRCTEFTINTHLKPMTDIQLRDVLKKTPELMSLNEIYRVAGTYEHGSAEWQEVMAVALREFPDDAIANCNAAALAIENQRYDDAVPYLEKAGDTDDANILRGIVATYKGDLQAARQYFTKAKSAPEAQRNLLLIGE